MSIFGLYVYFKQFDSGSCRYKSFWCFYELMNWLIVSSFLRNITSSASNLLFIFCPKYFEWGEVLIDLFVVLSSDSNSHLSIFISVDLSVIYSLNKSYASCKCNRIPVKIFENRKKNPYLRMTFAKFFSSSKRCKKFSKILEEHIRISKNNFKKKL